MIHGAQFLGDINLKTKFYNKIATTHPITESFMKEFVCIHLFIVWLCNF